MIWITCLSWRWCVDFRGPTWHTSKVVKSIRVPLFLACCIDSSWLQRKEEFLSFSTSIYAWILANLKILAVVHILYVLPLHLCTCVCLLKCVALWAVPSGNRGSKVFLSQKKYQTCDGNWWKFIFRKKKRRQVVAELQMKLAKQKNLLKAENKRYGKLLFKEYFLSHDINKFRYNAAKVTAYYILV